MSSAPELTTVESPFIDQLERIAPPKLSEANQQATELLMKRLAVDALPEWDHSANNTFTATEGTA